MPSDATLVDEAFFNIRLPKAVEGLLLIGHKFFREETYINGLGGNDFQNIPDVAASLIGRGKQRNIIRVVYGASTQMSARALSYILPGLVFMEHLEEAKIDPPQMQVIFADNISARLDNINLPDAMTQSYAVAQLARKYIEDFYPTLSDSVLFLRDDSIDEKGSPLGDELSRVTGILKREASQDLKDILIEKDGNHGTNGNHEMYGAAHLLIHDIDIPGCLHPIFPDQSIMVREPKSIISIGGYQERLFYRLRQALKPFLGEEYSRVKTLQYFTKHRVPPYYMARDGDLSLDAVMDCAVLNEEAIRALVAISRAVGADLQYFGMVTAHRVNRKDYYERQ